MLLLVVAAGCLVAALADRAPAPLIAGDPVAVFGERAVQRADAYEAPRQLIGVLALVLVAAVPVALAILPTGRDLVRRIPQRLRDHPVLAALIVGMSAVIATDLLLLPFVAWSGLVHDARFGFRTLSTPAWFLRWALTRLPGWLGVGGGSAVAAWLVRRLPYAWEPVLAVLAAVAAVTLILSGPLVIEPLTTRTTPLGQGPVRAAIDPVLERAGRGGTELVVADASRRTTKENAYVSGLGPTRHVVLYDTLLQARTPPEVAAVVAHELGHDLHADVERAAATAAAGGILGVLLVAFALRRLGGVPRDPAGVSRLTPEALVRALAVLGVAGLLVTPLTLAASRRAEAAADATAVALTEDPVTVAALLRGLATTNLIGLDPPAWAVLLLGSHPTPPDRVATALAAPAGRP